MDPRDLNELLEKVSKGVSAPTRRRRAWRLPYEDLGFAKIDHHREAPHGLSGSRLRGRQNAGAGPAIAERIAARGQQRAGHADERGGPRAVAGGLPSARITRRARCITVEVAPAAPLPGRIAVVCAGTSDLPVAEEAAVTAEFQGATVDAGLRRRRRRDPPPARTAPTTCARPTS